MNIDYFNDFKLRDLLSKRLVIILVFVLFERNKKSIVCNVKNWVGHIISTEFAELVILFIYTAWKLITE